VAYLEKKYHSFHLWKKGSQALQAIPGLKGAVLRGFKINLIIYLVIALSLNLAFHFFAKEPLDTLLVERTAGWLQITGRIVLVLLQVGIGLILMLFSLRVSLKFMGLWYESLVTRVLVYTRGGFEPPESRSLVSDLALLSLDIAKEVGISVGTFLVGLIPLIGPVLVFLITSHLMGKTVQEPYISVLKSLREKPTFGQGRRYFTVTLGWAQMLFALIPILGWCLLPVSLIYQVIGLAWQEEGEGACPAPSAGVHSEPVH